MPAPFAVRPAPALLALAFAWMALGILAAAWPPAAELWRIAGALAAVAMVADWLMVRADADLVVERTLPGSLPVGVAGEVRLAITNRGRRRLRVALHDHHPVAGTAEGLPLALLLPAGKVASTLYRFTPLQRGPAGFGRCDLRVLSPLRLWERKLERGEPTAVRVFPNFAALTRYALLATDNRLSQIGILTRRRRGEGMEFHQLREYREGDSQRQIDWKASSRMRRMISREYRDERDQQIVFLIDCGRRMSASDTDTRHLRHFDHVLNAALLLGYVSLRQGDAVGYMTFATPAPRFLAPRKSGSTLNLLLAGLYDIHPGLTMPDYYQAAQDCAARLSRRALVIILTNLRDEDDDELAPALKLLCARHLVMLASLREPALDETLARPVTGQDSALTYAAAVDYREARDRAFRRVQAAGAQVLDIAPAALPVALVNRYLEIKRAGLL